MSPDDRPSSRNRSREWDQKWSDPGYNPPWALEQAPEPVREAVAEGWLKGPAVLDLGCGLGFLSAWLAAKGYEVLGVDFSRAAVEKAVRRWRDVPGLRFEPADLTSGWSPPRPVQGMVDRGCLHGLDPRMRSDYALNLARWSAPGTTFLLLLRYGDDNPAALQAGVERLFRNWFDCVDVRPTPMEGPSASEPIPGAAFRFVRRAPDA